MNARTPAYVSDELEHANEQRARMVPQIEATRAMLAALKYAAHVTRQGGAHLSAQRRLHLNGLASDAIAQAEAAGIGGDK